MRQLTVVIADDDHLVLQDLKELVDWNKLGYHICGMALNGEQAQKLIEKHHPNLLITDIRMPGMDGLDLIETVYALYPQMRILVISAYNEFDYAKRAISNGVMDYLLKTEINAGSLTKKLNELTALFYTSAASDAAVYEQEFSRFLSAEEDAPITCGLYPHLSSLKGHKYYFSIIGRTQLFSRSIEAAVQSAADEMNSLKDFVYEHALEYCALPVVCISGGMLFVGLSLDTSVQPRNALRSFGCRLIFKLGSDSKNYVHFYSEKRMTFGELRALYRPLYHLLPYYLVFYPDRPVNLENLQEQRALIDNARQFPFRRLVMDEQHQEQNMLLIKDYVGECCRSHDIFALMNLYRSFCTHMEIISNNRLSLPLTLHAPTPEHLQKWLFNTLSDCILTVSRGQDRRYCSAVETAIQYINQNYSDHNLTALDIAGHACLSAGRLGVLFKQDTGKTVNEWLCSIRVERAVYLLENTNMKIYEISDKCGYKSSQYFSQIIYQRTGKRPIDFRKAARP